MNYFILILFVAFLVGALVFVFKMMKAPAGTNKKASAGGPAKSKKNGIKSQVMDYLGAVQVDDNAETAQEFLPFESIGDSMIYLGNGRYRMLIECSSINYFLKTEEEQGTVESQFRRAINSWQFPWAIYVQTRRVDNRKLVEETASEVERACQEFPAMSEYGQDYISYIQHLPDITQNNLIKRKFIIIGCDDAGKLTASNKEEQSDYALKILYERAQLIMSSLKSMGIVSSIVKSDVVQDDGSHRNDLAEVMYSAINRKVGGAADGYIYGDFMSEMVSGGNFDSREFNNEKLNLLINEFENKLNIEILQDRTQNEEARARARLLRSRIHSELNGLNRTDEPVSPVRGQEYFGDFASMYLANKERKDTEERPAKEERPSVESYVTVPDEKEAPSARGNAGEMQGGPVSRKMVADAVANAIAEDETFDFDLDEKPGEQPDTKPVEAGQEHSDPAPKPYDTTASSLRPFGSVAVKKDESSDSDDEEFDL